MGKQYYDLGSGEKNLLGDIVVSNIYDYGDNYEFDINTKNESHAAILRQVEDNSVVLDIGCASGIIGKSLKKYKNCIIDGIDYDQEALKYAAKTNAYRDLYSFSITEENSKKYKDFFQMNKKYDHIIFADVLEHLVDPWNAIKNATKLLKKNGSILISLPNIANIDTIKALINNEFNYQKHGVLDSTHLRFFTEHSFKDMIETLGERTGLYYNIELCERTIFNPNYPIDTKVFELFSLEKKKIEDFLVLQNIFKISLASSKKNVKYKGFKSKEDYFDLMDRKYSTLVEEKETIKTELEFTKKQLKKISEENQKNFEENKKNIEALNSILDSKRWKLINKILKLIGK